MVRDYFLFVFSSRRKAFIFLALIFLLCGNRYKSNKVLKARAISWISHGWRGCIWLIHDTAQPGAQPPSFRGVQYAATILAANYNQLPITITTNYNRTFFWHLTLKSECMMLRWIFTCTFLIHHMISLETVNNLILSWAWVAGFSNLDLTVHI